jgi:hypothetical protein
MVFRGLVAVFFYTLAGISMQAAVTFNVDPLEYECHVGDTPLLNFDVEGGSPGKIDIDVDGVSCDRRIQDLGGNRLRFLIAPETSAAGRFSGKVMVTENGKALGDPIAISGNVRPWIGVKPLRIFAGSIGHGERFKDPRTFSITLESDTAPFDIKQVELPEIKGASWVSDPPQGTPANKKILRLKMSPDALAEGVPFGGLARKFAYIETDHPEAPSLAIPITGMLSINTTGRDYSQYLYKGAVRWSGIWGTPNFAAAMLAVSLILLCGVASLLHRRLTRWPGVKWGIATAVIAAFAVGCYFLAQTYSRGGWAAMAAGTIALIIATPTSRFLPFALATLFALCVLISPAGLGRVASSAQVAEDKSISHRLFLWQGALQMMAEHPLRGVGAGNFGKVFTRDYQLPTHTQTYDTAINDFLTVGTERGIPILSIFISALLTIAGTGLWAGYRSGNAIVSACGAAILAVFVACSFSTMFFQSELWIVVLSATGVMAFVGLWTWGVNLWTRHRQQKEPSQPWIAWLPVRRFVLTWVCGATAVSALLYASSSLALRDLPAVTTLEGDGLRGIRVSPRWQKPKGTILYIGNSSEKPETLLKSTLRPLARRGWTVYCFEQNRYPSDSFARLKPLALKLKIERSASGPFLIAGHEGGASIALGLAVMTKPSTVAVFRAPRSSGFDDLSPSTVLPNLRCRVLLCQQRFELPILDPNLGNQLKIMTVNFLGDFGASSPNWQNWISAIDSQADAVFAAPNSQEKYRP